MCRSSASRVPTVVEHEVSPPPTIEEREEVATLGMGAVVLISTLGLDIVRETEGILQRARNEARLRGTTLEAIYEQGPKVYFDFIGENERKHLQQVLRGDFEQVAQYEAQQRQLAAA